MSEHAHLDQSPTIVNETRIGSEKHQKEIALKAMGKIEGAPKIIHEYFDKSAWKMPYSLPAKKTYNQAIHLGWA